MENNNELNRFKELIESIIADKFLEFQYGIGGSVTDNVYDVLLPLKTSLLQFTVIPSGYGYITLPIEVDSEIEIAGILGVV